MYDNYENERIANDGPWQALMVLMLRPEEKERAMTGWVFQCFEQI